MALAHARILLTSVAILCLVSTAAHSARPAFNCECRDGAGEMRGVGTVECISIGSSQFLVRCEMSDNNPYWARLIDQPGCPSA